MKPVLDLVPGIRLLVPGDGSARRFVEEGLHMLYGNGTTPGLADPPTATATATASDRGGAGASTPPAMPVDDSAGAVDTVTGSATESTAGTGDVTPAPTTERGGASAGAGAGGGSGPAHLRRNLKPSTGSGNAGNSFDPASQVLFYDPAVRYFARSLVMVDWRPATPPSGVEGGAGAQPAPEDSGEDAEEGGAADAAAIMDQAPPPREALKRLRHVFAPSHPHLYERPLVVFASNNDVAANHDRLEEERALVVAVRDAVVARAPHLSVAVFRGLRTGFERTVDVFRRARVVIGVSVPNIVFCGAGSTVIHLARSDAAANRCVAGALRWRCSVHVHVVGCVHWAT